ncbi:MAG: hypothetical protein KKC19_03980 [Nanoarchaeota archaeon]|nr:hypothetical protein [Nanoarchaeota archaeon]
MERKGHVIERDGGFTVHYFDSETGEEISTREAYIRRAKIGRSLERAYRENGLIGDAEKHQRKAEYYEANMDHMSDRVGCYITTACVGAKDLPDDCLELQTLRNFRDGYLANQLEGSSLIQAYYSSAPNIVKAINREPNAQDIFAEIFDRDIATAVRMILEGNNEGALKHYMDTVMRMRNRFL